MSEHQRKLKRVVSITRQGAEWVVMVADVEVPHYEIQVIVEVSPHGVTSSTKKAVYTHTTVERVQMELNLYELMQDVGLRAAGNKGGRATACAKRIYAKRIKP